MFDESLRHGDGDYSQGSRASKGAEETLLHRFNSHFRTMSAEKPDLLRQAQEIRYQVYCVERGFENPADHPDHREKDKFDAHSVHSLLIHQSTGHAVGTVRLVLPRRDAPNESFAIQRVIEPSLLSSLPFNQTAEVSRFSISKQFRDCCAVANGADVNLAVERQLGCLMSLGLIQALVRMSARQGITHWCAVMEPKLLRMLAAMAIHFKPLGAPVEYHGLRQPCYCHIPTVLERVRRDRPMFWQILTDAGSKDGCALAA
jgi:N-acyl amino acid synthase of PEP-CTERM/exosortase system